MPLSYLHSLYNAEYIFYIELKLEDTEMIEEYSLEGVRTYQINILPDERGFFSEVLRQDWTGFINETIVQANLSYSYPGVVRAWHRHIRGQIDHFLVLKGALKICAFEEETKRFVEIIANEAKSMLVRIPRSLLPRDQNSK